MITALLMVTSAAFGALAMVVWLRRHLLRGGFVRGYDGRLYQLKDESDSRP